MNILFITFSPLFRNGGHTFRLKYLLAEYAKKNDISILSLSNESESEEVSRKYEFVKFYESKVKFDGWNVLEEDLILERTLNVVDEVKPAIVIMMMEVWDLMLLFSEKLEDLNIPFATVINAMPFLGAPVHPSKDFENDVLNYCNTEIPKYRKKYNLSRYKEACKFFDQHVVIANNKTVSFYIKNYFPNAKILTMNTSYSNINRKSQRYEKDIDLFYMARMEAGKGVEYLSAILDEIRILREDKLRVAVAGRTDDSFSKEQLENLLKNLNNAQIECDYLGWIDGGEKEKIFARSKVFIYPSFYDNDPVVVKEAILHRLPVIAWEVPYSSIVYDNVLPIKKVSLGDVTEFARQTVEVLDESNHYSQMVDDYVKSTFKSNSELMDLDMDIFKAIIEANNE